MNDDAIIYFVDEHAPVVFRMGFLDASLDASSDAFVRWKSSLYDSVEVSQVAPDGLIKHAARLEPLTLPPRRSLFVATRSAWTAYLDNSILGTDAIGPVCHLSDVLGCRGVLLTCVPHTLRGDFGRAKGTYGAVQFELYGPGADNPLGCVRSVSATYDGGRWRFEANGSMQAFEDIDSYSRRRISDRFTPKLLADYARALGIDAFSEDYYRGDARLVAYENKGSEPARQCSLAEARLELGLL